MIEKTELKINTRELRAGNKLFHKESGLIGDVLIVDCFIDWITLEMPDVDHERFDGEPIDFEAIPLSEQWLIRGGFEESTKDPDNKWLRLITHNHIFESDQSTNFRLVFVSVNGEKVAYAEEVHKLQNLFFILRLKELTFKS